MTKGARVGDEETQQEGSVPAEQAGNEPNDPDTGLPPENGDEDEDEDKGSDEEDEETA
jgi:hypothetical protein